MNYELLQAFDLMSLFVCMEDLGDTSVTGTIGPVPKGMRKGDVDLQLEVREEGVVSVDPYPFDSPKLEVNVPSREIEHSYGSVGEVRRAMQDATTRASSCRFVAARGTERDAASAGAVREA